MDRLEILKINEWKFWRHVKKDSENGCWIWQAYKDKLGYGDFQFCHEKLRFKFKAHRSSFEFKNGKIPMGLIICHKCDNPSCVNPNHLFLGTHKDNVDDKVKKGRQAKGENNGRSKLNWEMVNEIRILFKENKFTIKQLCEKYSIENSSIRKILKNKFWIDYNYVAVNFESGKFNKGSRKDWTITEEVVVKIKTLIKQGIMPSDISKITGVKRQKIADIKRGIAYYNIIV